MFGEILNHPLFQSQIDVLFDVFGMENHIKVAYLDTIEVYQ